MPVILVVDDDPSVRTLLELELSDVGEVVTAADGDAALRLLTEHDVDLAVLDIGLPGVDGMTLLASLRADDRTAAIPVVMLTGRDGGADRVEGYRNGADAYLTKPFDPPALLALARTLLDGAADQRSEMMAVLKGLATLD